MNGTEYRDAVKQQYDFANWPRDDGTKRISVSRAFVFDPENVMADFVLEERSVSPTNGSAYIDRYVHGSDPGICVLVNITRYPSQEAAYEGLVAFLEMVMAPRIAHSTERDIRLGDIAYCGVEDPLTDIIFVRRNVLARLTSIGDKAISVVEMAQRIDTEILNSPQ
jgi:hypothetical protein